MRPHRQQPIRLPHPLDSPGKNTGVVCNFLLQCMKVKSKSEVAQSCLTLSDPMDCSQPGTLLHLKYLIDKSGYIHMYWGVRFWHNYWSEVKWSCSVMSDSLRPHGLWPTRFHCPWGFPGKDTGVGCHFLLQEIFSTQGLNPGLTHGRHHRQTLYSLSHLGSLT